MEQGGKSKNILFLVASILFPPLFPHYYTKYLAPTQPKHQKSIYAAGHAWLIVWLFIATTALPTLQKPQYEQVSYSSNTSDAFTSDTFIEQSSAYEQKFYAELKKAQPVKTEAKTKTAAQSQSATSQALSSTQKQNTKSQTSTKTQTNSTNNSAMSDIKIAEADNSPYRRADYGKGWNVGTGCNIRSRLLAAQSTVKAKTSNGCLVTYGSWIDPYSGTRLTGNPYQGDGEANDLDIDHIIPLRYVNQHGGYAWSHTQKQNYGKSLAAMNNGVYIAVSSKENRSKSDQGPADYYPSNPNFYCEYAKRWRNIARTYSISLSRRDYNKIKGVLSQCGIK